MDVEQLRRDKREIDKLLKTRGWAVVTEIMEKELVAAAMIIAEDRAMTVDEINFRRGAIWAAKQLVDLPDKLQQRLLGDLLMAEEEERMKNEKAKFAKETTGKLEKD